MISMILASIFVSTWQKCRMSLAYVGPIVHRNEASLEKKESGRITRFTLIVIFEAHDCTASGLNSAGFEFKSKIIHLLKKMIRILSQNICQTNILYPRKHSYNFFFFFKCKKSSLMTVILRVSIFKTIVTDCDFTIFLKTIVSNIKIIFNQSLF